MRRYVSVALAWALVLSVCLLPWEVDGAEVYHSPLNDGSEASEPVLIPPDNSVREIRFWIGNDRGNGLSEVDLRCAGTTGSGDEICGWDVHVRGAGVIVFDGFEPAADVVYSVEEAGDGPVLRANRVNAVDPNTVREPVGVLRVRAPDMGEGQVEVTGNLYVDTKLNALPVSGPSWGGPVAIVNTVDSDGDGILDDGDSSGTTGDSPCPHLVTTGCDDNCPFEPNADQRSRLTGINNTSVGNACECGDVTDDGKIAVGDFQWIKTWVGSGGTVSPGPSFNAAKCDVTGDGKCKVGDFQLVKVAVGSGSVAGLQQSCDPAVP
jgi:hypothetical protein